LIAAAGLGAALYFEMRVCRGSTVVLGAAVSCFAAAALVQLGWIMPEMGARAVMVEEGCELAGALLVWFSMLAHARFVIAQATGSSEIRVRRRQVAAASPEPAPEGPAAKPPRRWWFGKSIATETAHAAPVPTRRSDLAPVRRPAAAGSQSPPPAPPSQPPAGGSGLFSRAPTSTTVHRELESKSEAREERRLSKAERKALRRQRERDRRDD
jgi:hypothetical protein